MKQSSKYHWLFKSSKPRVTSCMYIVCCTYCIVHIVLYIVYCMYYIMHVYWLSPFGMVMSQLASHIQTHPYHALCSFFHSAQTRRISSLNHHPSFFNFRCKRDMFLKTNLTMFCSGIKWLAQQLTAQQQIADRKFILLELERFILQSQAWFV